MAKRFKFKTWSIKWLLPLGIAGLAFGLISPVLADLGQNDTALLDYVAKNDLEVGAQTVNDYQQVYYVFQGHKTFITSGSTNHLAPVSKGSYIVWTIPINGAGQIVEYYLPTKQEVQLTANSTNQNPKLERDGRIVWERWFGDRWQVMYFDGQTISQLTDGNVAVAPDILGNQVIFARQDNHNWWAELLDLTTYTTQIIKTGDQAAHPRFKNGQPDFSFTQRETTGESPWRESSRWPLAFYAKIEA